MKLLLALALLALPSFATAAPACPANGPYVNCQAQCGVGPIKCGPSVCGPGGAGSALGSTNGTPPNQICVFGAATGPAKAPAPAKQDAAQAQ